jgi:3-methyl-2-oxobutanoate hydroxymethyltransferase
LANFPSGKGLIFISGNSCDSALQLDSIPDAFGLYPAMLEGHWRKSMSITPIGARLRDEERQKITTTSLKARKHRREPIACLTCYDYSTARLVDEGGVDMILVGDSLAQTMLGYENTLSVTMDEMLHHVKAVRRGVKRALLLADMPYGSYQVDESEALRNATRFVKEGGGKD